MNPEKFLQVIPHYEPGLKSQNGAVIVALVNMWTYNRAIQKRHQRQKAALEKYIRQMDKGMEPRERKL